MVDREVQEIGVLILFTLLVLFINLKAGSAILKWLTFVLLLAGIAGVTWKVALFLW